MNKTVDVVIPTFHPDEKLCTLLKSLLEQKYPVGHILIMNTRAGVLGQQNRGTVGENYRGTH